MGSVLYLDRGMRRKGAAAAAARVQSTHSTPSILRPGYNCWTVARAERVAFLVDAADYFKAFYEAALRAKRSITILAWDFNSQTQLHFDPVAPNGPPALLGEFLNWLVQRRHSLHVHVLNWDYPMVFGADREFPPLYGFGWTPARRVHLRYDDTHPFAGCQHQKIVVIDYSVAFIGGIDLTVRRWDNPEHAADDPRRMVYGKPYPPFHDLMVAVDGEAARQLAVLTRERWLAATDQKLKPVTFRGYYPHVPGLAERCCLDVHSKLMVVDDRIVRVGSSNLCNRSLGLDTEADIAIEARGRPQVANAIRRFRDRLIAEHLGVPVEKVRVEIERTGGLAGAIKVLAHDGRSMRELGSLPAWSDAVVNVAAVADPEEPIALDELLMDRHKEAEAEPEKPAWTKLALIALLVLGLTALWRWTPLAHTVSAETVIDVAKDFGSRWWAPLVLMAAYTPACMVMFPRPLITLAAVIAFDPWLGFLYALVGIVASSIVTYYIGRRMRRDTVRRLAGPKLDRMIEVLKRYGLLAMTLLRLVPIAPFVVESIVAGAIHMRLWHVALGTAIGLLPGTLATTIFGDAIETALTGTGEVNWWLVGIAVGLLAGGIVAVKRWFTKMSRRIHAIEAADEQASRQPG